MNLVLASALLLAMTAFQPTLIYGSNGLASGSFGGTNGNGKKHSALSAAKSKASLVMQLESGDVYVRRARGAGGDFAAAPPAAAAPKDVANNGNAAESDDSTSGGGSGGSGGGGGGKRGKNNSKKSNKNVMAANMPAAQTQPQSTAAAAAAAVGKKHADKRFSAATANSQHGGQSSKNNKGKTRQLLKSQQQHQNHGRRAGTKSATTNGEKSASGEKMQSTCRYAKSAWTECDSKTNSKSRTLTLKKGESNCLPTRTIQKKCKKACRYEKGSWSECVNGQMTRQDKLKSTGSVDSSGCEAVRSIDKKCNPGGGKGGKTVNKERKNKDKASRRPQLQA